MIDFRTLLEILKNEDRKVPPSSLSELSDLDSDRVEELASIWDQIPTATRKVLLAELGQIADLRIEYCFEAVNRIALNDSDSEVRKIAIDNLWESKDPTLVKRFSIAAREDPTPPVRAAAARALGRFVYLGELREISSAILHDIEDTLLEILDTDDHPEVRCCSLESLGYSSRAEVSLLIQEAYDSKDRDMLRSALLAMGRSADPVWEDQVTENLHHPDPALRFEAARAAGELELRDTTSDLIELLDDTTTEVRRAAIWSLGQLGGNRAKFSLTKLLDEADHDEEYSLLQDALDHLAFVDGTREMLLFDFRDNEDAID
jgi:HEAT repeat protein